MEHSWNDPFWGVFWAPTPPNIFQSCWDFYQGLYLRIQKRCFKSLWEFEFLPKQEIPKICTFGPTYRIAIYLIALLPFKWKIGLLFALFEHFLVKIRPWPKVKGSKSISNLAYAAATIPGVSNMQRVWSHHFPILSFMKSKDVFFKFRTTFSSWAAFLGTTPTFFKKMSFFSIECRI